MSFLLGAAAPFIGRIAGSLVNRGIGWLKNKFQRKLDGGNPLARLGQTTANVIGKERFDSAMKQFGDNLQHRMINSTLRPVAERFNLGDQFHKQMNNIFDFVKGKTKTGQNEAEYRATRYPGTTTAPKANSPGAPPDVAAMDDTQMY